MKNWVVGLKTLVSTLGICKCVGVGVPTGLPPNGPPLINTVGFAKGEPGVGSTAEPKPVVELLVMPNCAEGRLPPGFAKGFVLVGVSKVLKRLGLEDNDDPKVKGAGALVGAVLVVTGSE
jgi:hypothetical protein